MNNTWFRYGTSVMPPLVMLLLVLIVWQVAVVSFDVPVYLLPGPVQIAGAAWENIRQISDSTFLTCSASVLGFMVSLSVGVVVALVFSQSRAIRNSCFPYAIFLQTVPIVAIAPLIIRWFGYGFQSIVIIAAIISLFPIIANATAGMLSVDSAQLDLFRLYNASRWQIIFKLRLPSAVPHIVTGAKTSAGLAVVGAIVGEFFVGSSMDRFGLGYLIRRKMDHIKIDELFAAVIASTLLGVAIFAIVNLVGATVLARWDRPGRRSRLNGR